MIEIRYVQIKDKEFWFSLDKHMSEQEFNEFSKEFKEVKSKPNFVFSDERMPTTRQKKHSSSGKGSRIVLPFFCYEIY